MRKLTQKEFFNRYQYNVRTDKIGGGSFGTVYKAFDAIRDRYVAIKVAEVKELSGRTFSLKDEIDAFQKLPDHSNIAHYEAVFQFELPAGIFDYAVMQYYPDGNLKSLLSNHALTEEQRETIILGILRGIDHLHQQNIIHRDLKPANILLAKRGDKFIPKITDFGLSKYTKTAKDSQFSNSFGGGTLAYSAPEQLLGESLRLNADIWSFGVIVYELFLAKNPFIEEHSKAESTASEIAIYNNIIKADLPADIQKIPTPYQEIVAKCIIKKPEERLRSANTILSLLSTEDLENIDFTIIDKEDERTKVIESEVQIEREKTADKQKQQTENKGKKYFLVFIGAILLTALLAWAISNQNQEKNQEVQLGLSEPIDSLGNRIKKDSFIITTGNEGEGEKIIDEIDEEEAAWNSAKRENTKIAYQTYLKKYKEGKFTQQAEIAIKAILKSEKEAEKKRQEKKKQEKKENKLWNLAVGLDSKASFSLYLDKYPNGKYAAEAKNKLSLPNDVYKSKYKTFKDNRDGQVYRYKVMRDGKKWMTQNLNYDKRNSWCFENRELNCSVYGRLYTYESALTACPRGWRLPTKEEWFFMLKEYGGIDEESYDDGRQACRHLKVGGDSKFNATIGGYKRAGSNEYALQFIYGYYWYDRKQEVRDLEYAVWFTNTKIHNGIKNKDSGLSCRCIK